MILDFDENEPTSEKVKRTLSVIISIIIIGLVIGAVGNKVWRNWENQGWEHETRQGKVFSVFYHESRNITFVWVHGHTRFHVKGNYSGIEGETIVFRIIEIISYKTLNKNYPLGRILYFLE